MQNYQKYFAQARREESIGNNEAALLFYLSAAYSSFSGDVMPPPVGAINKIARLRKELSISDVLLCELMRSYSGLSDEMCGEMLIASLRGDTALMRTAMVKG